MAENWTCSFCGHVQTATGKQTYSGVLEFVPDFSKYGILRLYVRGKSCSNPACGEATLSAQLAAGSKHYNGSSVQFDKTIDVDAWALRPRSNEKPQPDFIPAPLIEDYYEACRIRDLSPKASATLSRRCLQGMIRDFCGISKSRLIDEIAELRQRLDSGSAPQGVTAETVDAIDYVRSVGNIGAHMEKDIDLIVPVDANEAQSLIGLIELLFDEWYSARFNRQQRLALVKAVADHKAALKAQPKPEVA